jgi:hypothetical protein
MAMTRPRWLGMVVLLALTWMVAGPASAQTGDEEPPAAAEPGGEDACITAFEGAQTLREQGKLLATRRALETCSQARCPDFARSRCIGWLQEVEAAIPSVVIRAKGPDGQDTSAVRVSVDGKLVTESLGGTPIELDPGERVLSLEHLGSPTKEERIVATMGERNRVIEVRFELAPTPPPTATGAAPAPASPTKPAADAADDDAADSGGPSPIFWVALGLGGAGLVVGAITGGVALSQGADLQDRCPGGVCSEGERQDYDAAGAVADVSTIAFIAGGVLTAVGVVGLLATMGGGDDSPATSAHIEPILGPGALGVRGVF